MLIKDYIINNLSLHNAHEKFFKDLIKISKNKLVINSCLFIYTAPKKPKYRLYYIFSCWIC